MPLLCAREIDVPGALPRVIRLLLHCYADPESEPRHVYLREAESLRRDLQGAPVTGLEFNARLRDIPVYPAASTYAFDGELVKLASNETPFPPHPQVLEAVEAQLRTLNRYPDPSEDRAAPRISERTGVPPGRIAVGNGSCELLLAGGRGDARAGRGDRLRVAVVLDVSPPRRDVRRPRDHRAAERRAASTTSTRWRARSRPPRGS